jgi:GAF domain-containing protein
MEKHKEMVDMIKAVLAGETDIISGLANCSAVIKLCVADINWAGFYILKGNELVLGPFQGLPACNRIGEGKGVCGKAALDGKPLIVPNVHEFPGHIACDSASNSEIVVPLCRSGKLFGVLDVDSPLLNRFSSSEADALIKAGEIISAALDNRLI